MRDSINGGEHQHEQEDAALTVLAASLSTLEARPDGRSGLRDGERCAVYSGTTSMGVRGDDGTLRSRTFSRSSSRSTTGTEPRGVSVPCAPVTTKFSTCTQTEILPSTLQICVLRIKLKTLQPLFSCSVSVMVKYATQG